MSTHRNIDRICIVVLVLTLLLTVAFMNGERLGIRVVADEDAETYSGSAAFTANDLNGDWADNAYTTYITLSGSGGKISGNGAYFLNGDLVITNGGWYDVSGSLDDGGIVVDAYKSSKVWLRLSGVTINCTDDACLRIDQADKVFLTLAENTENSFTSGTDYSEDALSDGTGGTIFAHDDLTINGSGSLSITAGYKHGIDANDSLVITGGTITVEAPQDGIHVNDSFRFTAASVSITAGDDGIHSDTSIYVESGTILIDSCYEGLEAITVDILGGDITIYPSDDGINANGGSSGMDFGNMGFGGMRGNGGASDGGARMGGWGGSFTPPTDADNGSEARNGERPSFPDGMEPPDDMERPDGEEPPNGETWSGEDPQLFDSTQEQAAAAPTENTADTADSDTYIHIGGGTVTIINESGRDADGLDSNGSIYIDGGTIYISVPGDGGNCAIDYGSESGGECVVTGGRILAFGGSSMTEDFSEASTQCAVLYNMNTTMPAGTVFTVRDESGSEILSFAPAGNYSSVAFSAPELTIGKTYTLTFGDVSASLTLESVSTTEGSSGGMDWTQRGGMGTGKEKTERGRLTENG